MNKVSDRTLQLLVDAIRALDFDLKTGRSANITLGPKTFDMDQFARKYSVYVNDMNVGEVIEEIDPFV
jgi:hypothetical protein